MSYEVVNGYVCHNCTDVGYAKRNIDPQHPKDGPFGVNKDASSERGPAVVLGGSLGKSDQAPSPDNVNGVAAVTPATQAAAPPPSDNRQGGRIDLSV